MLLSVSYAPFFIQMVPLVVPSEYINAFWPMEPALQSRMPTGPQTGNNDEQYPILRNFYNYPQCCQCKCLENRERKASKCELFVKACNLVGMWEYSYLLVTYPPPMKGDFLHMSFFVFLNQILHNLNTCQEMKVGNIFPILVCSKGFGIQCF